MSVWKQAAKRELDPSSPARSVAEMRKPFLLLLLCLLPGCASTEGETRVDVMLRKTGTITDGTLELTSPALVNELNGAYTIHAAGYYAGRGLDANGRVIAGKGAVFALEFTDHGDISVLRSDDRRISLRAEFGPDGKVTNGLLGSTSGAVEDGFTSAGNDTFESGSFELLYEGPELVVGRFDLKFAKYRAQGNFRAPRIR